MKGIRIMLLLALVLSACAKKTDVRSEDCALRLCISEGLSRSDDPDEEAVWDVNLFVYNEYDLLEVHEYIVLRSPAVSSLDIPLKLVPGREYDVFAFANAGYEMDDLPKGELLAQEYFMAYPDEYTRGIPMAGSVHLPADAGSQPPGAPLAGMSPVELPLQRLMAKISVRIDRSALDKDVSFLVSSMRVGGCPKRVSPFKESSCTSVSDFFRSGFNKSGDRVHNLNLSLASGLSLAADLYMLENVRDAFDPDLCSYVEINVDYLSDSLTSGDNGITYRFYLREHDDWCVRRNSHYKITVCPRGNGIMCDDSWRLEKSALRRNDLKSFLSISPGGSFVDGIYYPCYYSMPSDSLMHFSLNFSPSSMDVHLREDLVSDERDDTRAEYVMDADGRGFTVWGMSRPCLSLMEIIAGEPLDDSETIAIEMR